MSKKGTFGYLHKDGRKKMKLSDLKEQLKKQGELSKMEATRILSREIERLSAKSSRKNKRKRSGGRKRKSRAKRGRKTRR